MLRDVKYGMTNSGGRTLRSRRRSRIDNHITNKPHLLGHRHIIRRNNLNATMLIEDKPLHITTTNKNSIKVRTNTMVNIQECLNRPIKVKLQLQAHMFQGIINKDPRREID